MGTPSYRNAVRFVFLPIGNPFSNFLLYFIRLRNKYVLCSWNCCLCCVATVFHQVLHLFLPCNIRFHLLSIQQEPLWALSDFTFPSKISSVWTPLVTPIPSRTSVGNAFIRVEISIWEVDNKVIISMRSRVKLAQTIRNGAQFSAGDLSLSIKIQKARDPQWIWRRVS